MGILVCSLSVALAQAEEPGETARTLGSEPESVTAGANTADAPPAKTSANGIEYRSGGVGKEERDALHLVSAKYPLKIVLSSGKSDAFVADATVRITGSGDKPAFEADGVGPLIFVNMPPGSYTVAVTAKGGTKEQGVSLASGKQTPISFSW